MVEGITVAELPPFGRWADKALSEDDRQALSEYLAYNPDAGAVIANSGGIRKVRWARPGMGKRGGVRIVYYFHSDAAPLYLITGYAKNTKDDLSADELATFRRLVSTIKARISGRK